MNAPALLDFPRIGPDPDGELLDSRLKGESDLHFYARLTRIYISKWLDADRDLENARRNGSNTEVIRKLEIQARRLKFSLESYSELLTESLAEKMR